jgi:hypothetical protein
MVGHWNMRKIMIMKNKKYFWKEMEKLMLKLKINFHGEEY